MSIELAYADGGIMHKVEMILPLDPSDYSVEEWDGYVQDFDQVTRCRDCVYAYPMDGDKYDCHGSLSTPWDYWNDEPQHNPVFGWEYCSRGLRADQK